MARRNLRIEVLARSCSVMLLLQLFFADAALAQRVRSQTTRPSAPAAKQQNSSPPTNIQRQAQIPQKNRKLNGGELYSKAREFFAAGRYAEAIRYAAAAQRRTRQSKLPTVLVAQSYYRLGKFKRAAKLFLMVPTSEIPKEAAVDYLLTMFSAGRYREVIRGYSLIPDNHPYKDVAKFYTGVSFAQFRLYQKAQYFLRNARKLPPSLISQKRAFLSEIDTVLDRERGVALDQGQAGTPFYFYSVPSAPPPPQVPEPILPGTPGKPAPAPKPAPPVGPSTSYLAKIGFDFSQKSTFSDYNGFREERSESRTPGASALLGLKYLGSPRPFGAQPALDLAINPGYSHSESVKSSSSLVANENDPDTIQNIVTKSESSSYAASNTYGITGLYPVSDPVDVSASYTVSDSYAKANPKNLSSTATAALKLAVEMELFKFDLGFDSIANTSKASSATNRTNSLIKVNATRNGENSTTSLSLSKLDMGKPELESDGVKSTTTAQLSWLRNFDDIALGLSARKIDKVRLPGKAKGVALSELSGKIEGSYNLSVGVSAVGSASYIQISNLPVIKGKDEAAEAPGEAMANGSALKYTASLKVAPASFVSLSASYEYTDRQLTIGEELLKKRMLLDNWSLQNSTSIGISASYSF
jgi:tetratricopeptide (TPR) repeat protein